MIVNINEQNRERYNNLFVEAYNFLVEQGKITKVENKTSFQSLPEYYSHMNDFFNANAWEYIFLPLDENAFQIDLNSRNISVPTAFRQAIVQSDTMSEMLIFEVDRYFDYMDLANTNIYVQWKDTEGKERATRIKMIDVKSVPNKLRFAWPLSQEVTKKAGLIKFSIRFFRIDAADSDTQKLVYSLNTTEASFNIIAAHQDDLNELSEVEFQNDELFNKVIINSQYSKDGIQLPLTPEFFESNGISVYLADEGDQNIITNLKAVDVANLKNDDTLSLFAEASIGDKSVIDYNWWYHAKTPVIYEPVTRVQYEDDPTQEYYIYEDEKYIKTDVYVDDKTFKAKYLIPIQSVNDDGEIVTQVGYNIDSAWYAVKKEDIVKGYRYYDKAEIAASEVVDFDALPDNAIVYRKFTKLTIESGSTPIIGRYYATAIGVNGQLNSPNSDISSECELPAPNPVDFKIDLESQNTDLKDGSNVTLKVEINVADNSVDTQEYQWFSSTTDPSSESVIWTEENSSTTNELKVSNRGWYYVEVANKANREKSASVNSNIVKVTAEPQAPVITAVDFGDGSVLASDIGEDGQKVKYTVTVENGDNLLYSEGLEYDWQESEVNANAYTSLSSGDWYVKNNNELIVKSSIPSSRSIRLSVTNKLNGKTQTTNAVDVMTFIVT